MRSPACYTFHLAVKRRPLGAVASFAHGNGVRAARSFDGEGKLTGIDITWPGRRAGNTAISLQRSSNLQRHGGLLLAQ
jgi:hypothetical protein